MIYTLLYHHAIPDRYGNDPEMLDRHFQYIADNYPTLHPGEMPKKHGVCLTFDDAYDDFPIDLLEKHQLKAVLAVPTALIGESGYLTWDQVKRLAQNPLIRLASHSHTHADLSKPADLQTEIIYSKSLIEPVDTFIFPYGKYSPEALLLAKQHYKYVMRIGSALNKSWDQNLIYRIPCDQLPSYSYPFDSQQYIKLMLKHSINSFINK